jgi:hypothetical protein
MASLVRRVDVPLESAVRSARPMRLNECRVWLLQREGDMGIIDQLTDDEKGIWHTYLCQARKLTRLCVSKSESQIEIKPPKTDDSLECCQKSLPASFYESINSLIFSVFTAEFRINLAARHEQVHEKKLTEYFGQDGKLTQRPKGKQFKRLSHYQKWINLPSLCGRPLTNEYCASIKNLGPWIKKRNDVVHAEYSELSQSSITPEDALECYEAVVDSIFELNVLLGLVDRQSAESSKREVSLIP